MEEVTSQDSTLSEEQRNRLDKILEKMEKSVRMTYQSHFASSDYYAKLARRLDLLTVAVLPSSTALLASGFNIKQSRYGLTGFSISLAASLAGLVWSGLYRYDRSQSPYHPSKLQEKHFAAGTALAAFRKEIIVFRELRMKDQSLTAKEFKAEYLALVEKKKSCDEIIQTDLWAYPEARKRQNELFKSNEENGQNS